MYEEPLLQWEGHPPSQVNFGKRLGKTLHALIVLVLDRVDPGWVSQIIIRKQDGPPG